MPQSTSTKDNDPCWKERQSLYKCLNENDFDKDKCQPHMLNGKYCKEFWQRVIMDRRQKGLNPVLPEAAEREKIKAEYMKSQPKITVHTKAS